MEENILPNPASCSDIPIDTPLRRSSRTTAPPIWLNDFSCSHMPSTNSATFSYPISKYLTYSNFSSSYQDYLAAVSSVTEPNSYHEAATDFRCQNAMDLEVAALEKNHTWDVVTLPSTIKHIGCTWVYYKIKFKPDGMVDHFKARIVAKGYTKKPGIDFHDTFSPTAKIVNIRCILKVTAINRLPLLQMDFTDAFLQRYLDEDIDMTLPEGYKVEEIIKLKYAS